MGLWKWNVKSATISGMKLLLLPATIAASLLAIGTMQIEQYDFSLLVKILTELPVVVLIVWLIIKLDDRRRQSLATLTDTFMKMHHAQTEQHRQDKDQLLEIIAHLRIRD